MVANCCTAVAHVLRLAHHFLRESVDQWVAGNGERFRPDIARRLWSQMLYQYLWNVQTFLPKVQAHFMRAGPMRFAAAFREPCCVGAEEATSYHELTMQLAERMLAIVRSCIGAPGAPLPREDLGVLERLPGCVNPPDVNTSAQLARGFCQDNRQAVVSAVANNFGPIREAFANDRVFSRFTPRHWQRLLNMTQKEAALVPGAHPIAQKGDSGTSGMRKQEGTAPREAKRPLATFISYSHKDESHRKRLDVHLAPLKRGVLAVWHDREIQPGEEWDSAIDRELEDADMILLLISADFLASKSCYEKEMQRAVERHDAGTATVIPIIVGPCQWKKTAFGKLQALPKDGRPVVTWDNQDTAWSEVVAGIERAADTLLARHDA